jgi:galactokinase
MGKHTDYAGGRSLLAAASKSFCVVSTDRDDNKCRIFTNRSGSTDPEELAALAACTEDNENQATLELSAELVTDFAWANYPATTLRRLCRNFGELLGVDMAIECDIPEASGMSTSSAMICTMFVVMDARNNIQELPLFKEHLKTKEDLYSYLGNCENGQNFNDVLTGDKGVGTFGGSEDHTAIMSCKPHSLNMFSYCPTQFLENVVFPDDLTFVIASSGAIAEKTGAAMGSYNNAAFLARDCTGAWNKATNNTAAFLAQACTQAEGSHDEKLASMAAEIAKFDKGNFPEIEGEPKWAADVLVPRFEQFYRESEVLVPEFAAAIKASDHAALAAVAEESQRRTDEQLKNLVPETQWLPQAARENGAIAASAFGAGFGGSVWAIVEKSKAADFMGAWKAAYEGNFDAAKNPACRFFTMVPGPGAFSLKGQRWCVDA